MMKIIACIALIIGLISAVIWGNCRYYDSSAGKSLLSELQSDAQARELFIQYWKRN